MISLCLSDGLLDFSLVLDHFHLNEIVCHVLIKSLLVSDVFELVSDALLVDRMLILIELTCATMNVVLSLVTMSTDSAKELYELSSMDGTHLDVEQ